MAAGSPTARPIVVVESDPARMLDAAWRDYELKTLVRIASALERIADRFDSDAKQFSEMVEKGKGLSA